MNCITYPTAGVSVETGCPVKAPDGSSTQDMCEYTLNNATFMKGCVDNPLAFVEKFLPFLPDSVKEKIEKYFKSEIPLPGGGSVSLSLNFCDCVTKALCANSTAVRLVGDGCVTQEDCGKCCDELFEANPTWAGKQDCEIKCGPGI